MTRFKLIATIALIATCFALPVFALTTEQGVQMPSPRANVTDPDEQQPAFLGGGQDDGNRSSNDPRGFSADNVTGPSIVRPGLAQEDRVGIPSIYNTPSH